MSQGERLSSTWSTRRTARWPTEAGDRGEIEERWHVREVSIVHRIGRVEPGEASVAIVVASPRRGEAFEASRYAIERIKQVVPIWKREVWSDGCYIWVGSQIGTRVDPP